MQPRKLLALLLLVLAFALPIQAQTPPPAPAAHAGTVGPEDIVFGKGGGRDLHAEIAYPSNTGGRLLPAVIFIHGGGWVGGSYKSSHVVPLAQAGYFAASIEYRLSKEAKWPAQIEDCKLAVRWLRANAAKYNVDPNRIGVWGESAGGHLVTCLGTMGDQTQYDVGEYPGVSSAVQAVVDFYGPTDFTRPGIYSPNAIKLTEGLMGTPYSQNPELWKSASPIFFVKAGDPPMLIVQGDADTLVPPAQSTDFAAALTKASVPCQLVLVKNGGHGFGPMPGTQIDPGMKDILLDVKTFFDKNLKAP